MVPACPPQISSSLNGGDAAWSPGSNIPQACAAGFSIPEEDWHMLKYFREFHSAD